MTQLLHITRNIYRVICKHVCGLVGHAQHRSTNMIPCSKCPKYITYTWQYILWKEQLYVALFCRNSKRGSLYWTRVHSDTIRHHMWVKIYITPLLYPLVDYWSLTLLQDPFPLGEIILGPSVGGYWVDEEVPEKLQHYTNIFMLHTPARSKGGFPLLAEDATSKAAWIAALQEAFTNSKHMRVLEATSTSAQCREELSYEEEENISTNVTTVF